MRSVLLQQERRDQVSEQERIQTRTLEEALQARIVELEAEAHKDALFIKAGGKHISDLEIALKRSDRVNRDALHGWALAEARIVELEAEVRGLNAQLGIYRNSVWQIEELETRLAKVIVLCDTKNGDYWKNDRGMWNFASEIRAVAAATGETP